jgi:predicted SnoaL-like aldol condensation-catalyzing enzyme
MPTNGLLRSALVVGLAVLIGGAAASFVAQAAAEPDPAAAVVNAPMAPNLAAEAAHVQMARDLYAAIFAAKDFAVAERYLGPEYIQHAAGAADGKAGLAQVITLIAQEFPNLTYDIKHITAEGNLVVMMTHIHWTQGSLGTALSSVYRFSDGKVVEHWETLQDVPATSANGNGMF